MADLCYICIYIIKWFLKSPACFRSHTKYEICFNWSMHTVEQLRRKKSIFWFLKKKLSISGIAFEHETTGKLQCIQYVNKC